jgi:hypothetical protein
LVLNLNKVCQNLDAASRRYNRVLGPIVHGFVGLAGIHEIKEHAPILDIPREHIIPFLQRLQFGWQAVA